jgi:hypothetical protein
MLFDVSQLSSENRRQLLAYLESTMGRSQYHSLVDAIGEDALLEQVARQLCMERPTQPLPVPAKQPRVRRGAKQWLKDTVLGCLWVCLWVAFFLVVPGALGNNDGISTIYLFAGFAFFGLSKELRATWAVSTVVGVVLGLIIGGLVGALVKPPGGVGQGLLMGGLVGASIPTFILYFWGLSR